MNDRSKQTAIVRQEFTGTDIRPYAETASTAVAARERAAIEARYVMAERHPRNVEEARIRLLKECERPGFAEDARYKKPVGTGKFVEGPNIRFAEVALRCWTNVYPEAAIVFEDEGQRLIRVSVTDLEVNLTYSLEILIKKTVERKNPREGQDVISERENSRGETVYLVAASEDEIQNKQNALISKAIRNSGLRLIPGDIVDECMAKILETQRSKDKQDPDAAKRKIIDAFAEVGVHPADIQAYLGHNLDRIQPVELAGLRAVYASIRDGEATWNSVMEASDVRGSTEAAERIAQEKIASLKKAEPTRAGEPESREAHNLESGVQLPGPQPLSEEPPPLTEEQMRAQTEAVDRTQQPKFSMRRKT